MRRTLKRARVLAALTGLVTLALGSPAAQAACPNEAARLEQGSIRLPDCRAYEQVTPPYKGGFLDNTFISSDGSKAILQGSSIVAGTAGTGESPVASNAYEDQRTGTGWQLTPLNAPLSEFVLQSLLAKEPDSGMTLWDQHLPSQSAYTKGLYAREPGANGKYKYLGPLNVPYAGEPEEPADWGQGSKSLQHYDAPLAATRNYGHVLLQATEANQLWPFDTSSGRNSVYEYSGVNNAHPILVAVNSPTKGANEPLVDKCGTLLGSGGEFGGSLFNSLSADGESVVFTAEACGGVPAEVWVRRHGALIAPGPAETINVSPDECMVACGSQASGVEFEGASEDGSIIYMTSTQKLTNDAVDGTESGSAAYEEGECRHTAEGLGGCNLYVFDFNRPGTECQQAHHCLSLVAGEEVLGVAGIAENGQRIYYVKRVGGTPELFVWDKASGESKLAAVLSYTGEEEEKIWRRPFKHSAEVSGEDGRYLLFVSQTPGLTPDDHTHTPQLFEYDAVTGELVRVSKGEDGYSENGNAAQAGVTPESIQVFAALLGSGSAGDFKSAANRLNVSLDGRTVVFETTGQLSPLASSAEHGCSSIYEFRTPGVLSEGTVRLISDGVDRGSIHQSCGAIPSGIDAKGENVLFQTADSLVPGDTDGGQEDEYDARVNGGFSLPPSMLCAEPECGIPSAASAPATSAPASTSLTGPGNLPAQPAPPAPPKPEAKPPSRSAQLAKALRACRKDHNSRKRKTCETQARKKYGTAVKASVTRNTHRRKKT